MDGILRRDMAAAGRSGDGDGDVTKDQVPNPSGLMKLPAELRLNIAGHVASQNGVSNLEECSTGETLCDIWRRLFLVGNNVYISDEATFRMIHWRSWCTQSVLYSSDSTKLYKYQLEVPALLQTDNLLREEGWEAYLRTAKSHMSEYEREHEEALRVFVQGLPTPYVFRYTFMESMKARAAERRRQAAEMTERCIRWYALKQMCMLLEAFM